MPVSDAWNYFISQVHVDLAVAPRTAEIIITKSPKAAEYYSSSIAGMSPYPILDGDKEKALETKWAAQISVPAGTNLVSAAAPNLPIFFIYLDLHKRNASILQHGMFNLNSQPGY